jgi:predicted phosphate transport protein (TIGR00153 family)
LTLEVTGNRAENKAIGIAQDHAAVVLQAAKALRMMIEDWMEGQKERQKELFNKLADLERQADSIKRSLLDELSVSETMLRRSDYFRLAMTMDNIADICEATAWDLTGLEDYKPDAQLKKQIQTMLDSIDAAVYKMRQAILLLAQNSSKAIELAMEVDAAERSVDEGHRKILQWLYKSNLDILVLLRLKDLTQHLEEIADAAEDAADAIRIIAVARGH